MDKWKMRMFFLTGVMTCFSFLLSYAQPTLKTTTDKSEILIGDQFKLRIEAGALPEKYKINWLVLPDTLQHFEVINRGKIDSLYSDNKLTGLTQTITLTSFDSGKWIFPSFLVSMVPTGQDPAYNLFTDSVPMVVSFSTADTTNVLKDIKPIREAEKVSKLWYWIGAGVLVLAIIVFLVWFFRFYKKNKTVVPLKTRVSAFEEAMQELQTLKGYNLTLPAEIRSMHTKLSDLLKKYLTKTQKVNYANKTTGDILIFLRDHYLDKDMPATAAACLRIGDAVKFAKYLPPVRESEDCLSSAEKLLRDMHQQNSKPETTEPSKTKK